MTSAEKRRSSRKSGGHRKHSDGGYSDTSSGGSFLDETDREVSNLTDRAFRSLCIGDEAVYNDSDLCSSSPCTQRDRQLAFSQSGQDRDREDREREELKRAAHESFSLRMQQYGQDWIHEGMYGAEIHRDPQWGVYGERTQGRVSATFQHSFMEMSQQEKSLNEEQLSFFSNGATELSSQQRRSRSRVSSLIRAFNSEGHRDGAGMDGKLRDWNDETTWDKSALMSIQRELSEFSTSYQQNFDSGHFPPAGPFSSQGTNFYSSEVAAVAHMNSASSFMRSSHSKHSMLTQVNCNSNFFIHSEFSPFRVWRDHNRFPFQQGEVSGFMHCSEFPKWCETPMYKELSLEAQPQGPSMFEERGIGHQRNTLAPMVPATPSRSTSTSTMLQKASAVEKRCESELAGHYPNRKRTQNRLPSQRPSTASPTIEMSRRVRDTISSVKALQHKIKMMTEKNITTELTTNKQEVFYGNENLIPFGNNAVTVAPDVVRSNSSTAPFNISQLLTPQVHVHQETSEVQQYAVSPQPVEHAPVRAESRGATPDVRMSSYKSRATSLLFNLKDNRKRVKSTYSPTKFKGLETLEKNKQPSFQEPRDIVIDIPEFPDPDIQIPRVEESSWTNEASHQYVKQYHSTGLSLTATHSQSATAYTGQISEHISSEYQTTQVQDEMVHHSGFTGYIPENYSSNQLANGQNLHEDLSSCTPYKQGMIENVETLGGDIYRDKPTYKATDMPRLNAENSQIREYLKGKANTQQRFNEAVGSEYTKVDRYQQLKENKYDYSNVSSQDRWRQTNNQDTEKLSLNADIAPWKQEISALMEKDQHEQDYQKAAVIKEELSSPRDKYRRENPQSINKEHKQMPQYAPPSNDAVQNPAYHGQQQPGAFRDKYTLQKYYGQNEENEMKENYLTPDYNRYTDQEYRNKHTFYSDEDKTTLMQETGQKKQYSPMLREKTFQPKEAKKQFEHNMQKNSLSVPDKAFTHTTANREKDRQFVEVKAAQDTAEQLKAQRTQAELAKAQHWDQVEQPKAEPAKVILAGQTGSEKAKAELTEQDSTKQANAEFKMVDKAQAEHNVTEQQREEQRREKQTEQSRGKKPERAREELIRAEQTSIQNVTVPRNATEEAGAEHAREEQSERVKTEQADAERLKEEHIKTELAKTEQAGHTITEQAKIQSDRKDRIKPEQVEAQLVRAEQVEIDKIEAEQIRTVKVKAELAEAECRKVEQAKLQQIRVQQAKAGQEKTKVVGVGNVKAEHNVEVFREKKAEEDSIQADQINAEQLKTETNKANEANTEVRKAEQTQLEQTKVELAKSEITKTQKIQEWSAKSTAKLTMPEEQVRNEPSKVEQVKTELAKAKAELAKIKEKMRGEQKEKARSTVITKEDDIAKRDFPFRANINKNEEQDQAPQMNQQKNDSVVSSNSTDRGAEDYESLREKYGLTNAISTNRNKGTPAGNVFSNDVSVTSSLALDKVETMNNKTPKEKYSPTSKLTTPKTENKEEVGSVTSNEVTESHYIYSESSKEFKLSSGNYLPPSVDKRTNSEKGDPLKQADVSQQRDSDLAKPPERKPKSSEHSVVSGFTPPRTLFHKERIQTKQEILTSRIKAHAEKEISAIKEKGFALPDGFISKNSTKQLSGSQSINIRQRPPSHEVSRRYESTMPSNTTPKQQMGPSAIQMEPVKAVSLSSSAVSTSQIPDPSRKQVPKEPMKSIDTVPEAPTEAKQAGSYATSTDGGLTESQKKEDQPGIRSPTQALNNNKGKQEVKHGENSEKPKEGLMNKTAINTEQLNKKKEDPSQATSKHVVNPEDSSPSLKLAFGQNETSVADDSLEIMGITVTVQERMSDSQGDLSTREQTQEDHSNAEQDKCHPSSGIDISKEIESSTEVSTGEANDRVAQETHPTVKEDQITVGMNNHPENMQETSTRKNNVTEKRTTPQHESSYINERPQREIQLHEPLTEKDVPPMVTVPAKNKVLAETQPHLYKQDIIAGEKKDHTDKTPKENSAKIITKDQEGINTEEKNPQTIQTEDVNEKFKAKVVNTVINYKYDFYSADTETLIKDDVHPSVKEDIVTVINPSKSMNIDDKSAPQLEEKRHDSTQPKPFSKTSPSNHLAENENRHVPPKHQHIKMHTGENNQGDDNVHIDGIAIRVVPAVTENDNLKMMGNHHITAVPSDVVVANEHKQVESSTLDEKVSTLNKEDWPKDPTPTSIEGLMKDNFEGKVHQQSSQNVTSENTHAENRKPEKIKKNGTTSKTQPMEGDYFQVQGVIETNDEPYNNSTNVGDRSDAVSKRRELPGLLPNIAAISNESYKEGKHEVFALDQSKKKTVESCPVNVQEHENMKKHNRETEDKTASKSTDCPTERQSDKSEIMDASQAVHIRKHHTERKSNLSTRERHSRNSQPTRENAVKEKPEVKPKPRERTSTIPEISAIADYARLKVIVSEETANTIQEFPPNKKEGFFPLIQSRHNRRPVFTADPQDLSVKEKSLPNKTEVSSKVNKEPKPVVFPITEKEHQRTGMFKLGEKERQEKMLLDVKDNEGVLETGTKHAQDLAERKKLQQAHIKNQGEEVVGAGTQRFSQVDQSIHQPNNHPMQTTTSSSSANKPRNASVSQHLKPLDTSNPHEKTEYSSAERMPNLDRDSHPQPIVGQMYNMKESKRNLRKGEKIEDRNTVVKIGEDRTEKQRQESLSTPHEETTVKPQSRAKQWEESSRTEVEKRAEDIRVKNMIEERRTSLAEEERRAALREEERRAREREAISIKIKERREKLKEAEQRAVEERKAKQVEEERAAQKEEEGRRAKQREEERRMREIEEERRAKLRAEEERMKEIEERRVKQREEERAAQDEQQRRDALIEEQRRARQVEEEKRLAHIEEERNRKQRELERAAQEEQQKRAALIEEQRQKAKKIEKRLAYIEEERKRKQIEEERAAQEEQQKRDALIEEQRLAKQVEEEKRLAYIEEERKIKQIEEERAAQEEQQRRNALIEEQRRAKQVEEEKRLAYIEEERKRKQIEEEKAAQIAEEKRIKKIQEQKKHEQQILEQRRERQKKEEWMRAQKEEEERRAVDKEKAIAKQREEQQTKEEKARLLEEASQTAQREEKRVAKERLQAQREEEIRAKKREDEKLAAHREKERAARVEEQKRAAQRMDALQYYAITSTESERKPRERQLRSPIPSQQRNNASESTEDSGSYSRLHRSHATASPAPSLPRSSSSSPALGVKPSMFRVKDNTFRGFSFTKSVKPRFHKNFGEDFRVGSPMGSERGEEEQDIMRRNAGTPIHPDTVTRLAAIKETSPLHIASSSQDYSAPPPHYRPYSRRSFVLDEDDSRSVISNMSEDVESFATSAADLADLRGLYDYERPESACSFSSDVSRLGKPPAVPPKSEKALLRAKRLAKRRIKKEMSKTAGDSPAEKSLQEVPSIPSSSSEVCYSNRTAVASPHFSPPVSLAHAPTLGSRLPSSHTEHQPSHRSSHASPHATTPISFPVATPHATTPVSFPVATPHATTPVSFPVATPHATTPVSFPVASPHATTPVCLPVASPHVTTPVSFPVASPHATGPVSLPVASAHATGPVSLPVASPHATGPVSHPATPKTVAHVPSSPILHHANHPAPVTQYHVESSYPQSYPLTQRKVLQDLDSGQYFVVDVPVKVKTKTFFDPETGKYVQLNVRESGKSTSRPQSQQPHMQAKQQQQPLTQASPGGKPLVVYQGYHGNPQGYQPAGVSSVHPQRSSSVTSAPVTLSQDQQPVRENNTYRHQAPESGQNSEGHRYSPEKTPYMDTVNDKDKTHNTVYNTHGSNELVPECDTNSQLAGSSVCENDNSAHSRYQSCDIITMGELEDFMEVYDW
ncbi:cardiac-enriched FHL2-interacting protein isoform X1 [Thunnus thynnus]|uniref:cardiac-enriched FHL2-interacting protein isoform X1 n=1 Tax=Thunnus thynnus TaxID=8237 RepID=UPI003527D45C